MHYHNTRYAYQRCLDDRLQKIFLMFGGGGGGGDGCGGGISGDSEVVYAVFNIAKNISSSSSSSRNGEFKEKNPLPHSQALGKIILGGERFIHANAQA
ncbi:Hypothetical predicted protein [Octopus vulgaris]|uniref:Uncharacterized protein n=1 Tax=Octopus vulgaris TaxID=6645 RepID=A0AA36BEB7_OCTVU|nr:Hypothetical predicted protein [Octopus vulgaris]